MPMNFLSLENLKLVKYATIGFFPWKLVRTLSFEVHFILTQGPSVSKLGISLLWRNTLGAK